MTDKKPTDNEIIKASECCMNGRCDDDCPFRETIEHCHKLDSLIHDLINRQKHEIECLKATKETLLLVGEEHHIEEQRLRKIIEEKERFISILKRDIEDNEEMDDAITRQAYGLALELENAKAEIERLNTELEVTRNYMHDNGLE